MLQYCCFFSFIIIIFFGIKGTKQVVCFWNFILHAVIAQALLVEATFAFDYHDFVFYTSLHEFQILYLY